MRRASRSVVPLTSSAWPILSCRFAATDCAISACTAKMSWSWRAYSRDHTGEVSPACSSCTAIFTRRPALRTVPVTT
jgi:hypothetical protein